MQATPAHGGGLIFFPTRKSHQRSIPPSPFLILPPQLRSSAVSKRPLLHPLHLCRSERWNSNAETFRTRNFKLKEEEEGEFSEPVDEFVRSIWILKAVQIFKAYGWSFPPIVVSLLLANGLKAFLVALALPIGQSVFMIALQKLWGTAHNDLWRKNKKRSQRRTPTININARRRARKRNTKKSDVFSSGIDQDDSAFGGWDELEQAKDYNMSGSSMGSPQPKTSSENGKLSRSTERGKSTP